LFPYEFAGVLVAVLLLGVVPRRLGRRVAPAGWAAVVIVLVAAQLEWAPIMNLYNATRAQWKQTQAAASQLMAVYDQPAYRGKVLNVPPDNPGMFYAMVEYHGLQGRNVVGQLYDPFYYASGFSYAQHPAVGDTLMQCWLTSTHTRLWAVDPTNGNYKQAIADQPSWFTQVGTVNTYGWLLEDVHAPVISPQECSAAGKQATG
jgi:hypothetical protein